MQFGIDQDWFIEQHIFIYTGYTVLNSVTILKDELERMMEEVVLDYSKVVSQHMPWGAEENHKISVWVSSFQAKNQLWALPNMK